MKERKKPQKPSSLHHYTSMSTLVALLNGIENNKEGIPHFTFHASNAFLMNDKLEGKLLLDRFFTESKIKTKYQEQYAQIENEEGDIYVISICKSDNKSANTGSIPMWSMYGDKGNGAILVFDFKELKKYIDQQPNLSLHICQYINKEQLSELTKKKNEDIKKGNDIAHGLSTLREEAFVLKDWHWEYESEWRILVKSKDFKMKNGKIGPVSYSEVHIPVNCIKSIIVGPLVDDAIKNVLNKCIKERCEQDKGIDIKLKSSNLQIR